MLQEVAVVAVKHGADIDRPRQIRRTPAVRRQLQVQAPNHPALIEAHPVIDAEAMTLAGDGHVVVPVQPQLHRTPGLGGGDGGDGGKQRRRGLLAAESAPHAPALHHHILGGAAQGLGDDMLHLRRMLGGGLDEHGAVFPGAGQGDLPLQIEMILSAHPQPPPQAARGLSDGLLRLAADEGLGRQHERPLGHGAVNVQDGGQRLILDPGQARRLPRGPRRIRQHREHGLPHILHQVRGENGVVLQDGAVIVDPRHILRRDRRRHPRRRQHGRQVQTLYPPMGLSAETHSPMQQALGFRRVIHIQGLPAHMEASALVGSRVVHKQAPMASRPGGQNLVSSLMKKRRPRGSAERGS